MHSHPIHHRRIAPLLALALLLGATASSFCADEKPNTPAPDASDAAWAQWREERTTWLESLNWRARNTVLAQEAIAERSSAGDTWQLAARRRGLSSAAIHRLDSDGVVATGRRFTELDRRPDKPLEGVFVTSDLVLHAYNLMVADFIRALELQRAPKLRRDLRHIWLQLPGWAKRRQLPPEQIQRALEIAQNVVGTALLCLETEIEFDNSMIEQNCRNELRLIEAATDRALPQWLGVSGSVLGIDYTRMKPVGFYAENETLGNLFRAVRWLQAVPFDPAQEDQLIAFAILADIAKKSGLFRDDQLQRQWVGRPNALCLATETELGDRVAVALASADPHQALTAIQDGLAEREPKAHANDLYRLRPPDGKRTARPLHALPAYLSVDSLLIAEAIAHDPIVPPDGRILASFLGDDQAFTELAAAGFPSEYLLSLQSATDHWVQSLPPAKPTSDPTDPFAFQSTFNDQLLFTWAAIFRPPEAGSPPFVQSRAWRAKCRNTVLSAWAGKRHTWTLHEVEPVSMAGGVPPEPPPGMIEPNPEFFRRLAALVDATTRWMQESGYFDSAILSNEQHEALRASLKLARIINELGLTETGAPATKVDWGTFQDQTFPAVYNVSGFPSSKQWPVLSATDFIRLRSSALRTAEAAALGLDPDSSPDEVAHPPHFRRERWERYAQCVHRLEAMARRQLAGTEWDDSDREYLRFGIWQDYYWGAMTTDAGKLAAKESTGPLIVPIVTDVDKQCIYHAATGEMEELYVLYPWNGQKILLRGPIIPFHAVSSSERLTDRQWRQRLDSDPRPEWLSPMRP